MTNEPTYTVLEAAKILGISDQTVYRMLRDKVMRGIITKKNRRGITRIIPKSEVERLKPFYEITEEDLNESIK